ncbi:ComF family protein, partial [Burkholderia sp. Ac-20344]|nr:ComF family protein [Burkholderia sp. Ac-20344]
MIRRSTRHTMRVALSQVRVLATRVAAVALPNRCALCGNLSHAMICGACDAAYWNEARLRCDVCALPLGIGPSRSPSVRGARTGAGRSAAYRCDACRTAPPPFDATLALADYRAPLDGLARRLKFHRQLALGAEFAARLARLIDDTPGASGFDLVAPVPLSHR